MRKLPKFSPEVVGRAVRMVFEAKEQYPSQWAGIKAGLRARAVRYIPATLDS